MSVAVAEAAGAAEHRETMNAGVPFHGRGRVDAPCLLIDHVHARPQ